MIPAISAALGLRKPTRERRDEGRIVNQRLREIEDWEE